jgi:hypothetical protein
LDYHNLALKYIHKTVLDDGEFYLCQHSKAWFEALYFSKNDKQRVNNHNDSSNDRLSLRGDLKEIEYALKVVHTTG